MVGFKNRYLVMEIFLDPDKELGVDDPIIVTQFNLSKAIKDSILVNFGECGLGSSLGSFQVKYVNPITKLIIIRTSREEYQKVWAAITMVTSIGNCPVLFNLLDISGCIRTCKAAALKCEEAKLEQHKLVVGTGLTDEVKRQVHSCIEKIKISKTLDEHSSPHAAEHLLFEQVLDYSLVPAGLVVMVGYHLWLLHRLLKHPIRTVIGINAINRRIWVHAMMEDMSKNGVLAVQTLRNNIMASTLLASTAIMLSSVIAVLMSPARGGGGGGGCSGGGGSSTNNQGAGGALEFVFGDRSQLGSAIKFFCILVCFLLAFLFNVQSIRYYSHASILVNVPFKKLSSPYLTGDYVAGIVNRGSYFWSLGLRAFYFSFPLFLWIFGPLPMFLSCIALVVMLYFLDFTLEFGAIGADSTTGVDAGVLNHEDEDEEQGRQSVGLVQ
ncbi:hypothetical protein Dimus_000054 [Dionaea muscipula]